jgi:NitT/TauT family transport system substrate-binding protein
MVRPLAQAFNDERGFQVDKRARGAVLVGSSLVVSLLVGCGGESASDGDSSGEARSLTVAAASPSQITYAAMWVAEELGCYAAEDLDVEIVSNVPGGSVEDALRTGRLDFGGSSSGSLINEVAKDGGLQIFTVDNMFPFRIVAPKDGGPSTAEELRGKTIGMPEASDEGTVEFLMHVAGIEKGEYQTEVTGGRAAAGVALQEGRVDAFMGSTTDQLFISKVVGLPINEIETGNVAEYYNSGMAATTEMLEKDRDVAVRFGRALAKATVWAFENAEATIDILGEIVPEAVEDRELSLQRREFQNGHDALTYENRFDADLDVWQSMIDDYADAGLIDESFPADKLFTDELLEDIWDFDVEAVVAAAKADERGC